MERNTCTAPLHDHENGNFYFISRDRKFKELNRDNLTRCYLKKRHVGATQKRKY